MKLVKVERDGAHAEGVLEGDVVRVIGGWREGPAEHGGFALAGSSAQAAAALLKGSSEKVTLSSVRLAVPVDALRRIICVGLNYRDHAGEAESEAPQNPMLFTRSLDSLVAAGAAVVCPRVSEHFDYEGEIAIVIGRDGRHIPPEQAMDYVAGYSCFLDGSIRDYQKHALTTGKNFWRSGAMGPWIVTADEVAGQDIALTTRLNGEVVQSAKLSQLIFTIPQLISYCSRWTWLRPGDVIATGTPSGVGAFRTPPLWMRPGDTIEVDVEGVGTLRNTVVAEEQAAGLT